MSTTCCMAASWLMKWCQPRLLIYPFALYLLFTCTCTCTCNIMLANGMIMRLDSALSRLRCKLH